MTPSIPAITSRSLRRSGPFPFLISLLLLASWHGVAVAQDDSAASPDAFGDGANPAEVAAAFDSLVEHAALVEEHSGPQDAQMRFLARSLARDSLDLRRFYTEGRSEPAAYLIHQITENCVVCHTRLLGSEVSQLTERSVAAGVLIEATIGETRAQLQMATRRFDDALDTLEDLLDSQGHPAMLLGPLTDYLVVSIRVKGDYERALAGLRRFAARSDLWERLRLDVEAWITALPELRERASRKPDLATARRFMEEGHAMGAFSEGHAALAHLVVASSILQRLVSEADSEDRYLAEAYYLLGVTEARIGRNYWVTAAPFMLETAIRLAPEQPFADEAIALLDLEMSRSYEGSDFEKLPPEDAQLLRELKRLVARDVVGVTWVTNDLFAKTDQREDWIIRDDVGFDLEIDSATGTTIQHSDVALATAILDSFRRDWTTSRVADRIRVGVEDGVATLTGDLDTWDERLEAGSVALGTEGVGKVHNRLTVKGYDYEREKWDYEAPYYFEELFPNIG